MTPTKTEFCNRITTGLKQRKKDRERRARQVIREYEIDRANRHLRREKYA